MSRRVKESLDIGQTLRLTWEPGRIVTLKYQGNDVFVVEESVNSKLRKGDAFTCHLFAGD